MYVRLLRCRNVWLLCLSFHTLVGGFVNGICIEKSKRFGHNCLVVDFWMVKALTSRYFGFWKSRVFDWFFHIRNIHLLVDHSGVEYQVSTVSFSNTLSVKLFTFSGKCFSFLWKSIDLFWDFKADWGCFCNATGGEGLLCIHYPSFLLSILSGFQHKKVHVGSYCFFLSMEKYLWDFKIYKCTESKPLFSFTIEHNISLP